MYIYDTCRKKISLTSSKIELQSRIYNSVISSAKDQTLNAYLNEFDRYLHARFASPTEEQPEAVVCDDGAEECDESPHASSPLPYAVSPLATPTESEPAAPRRFDEWMVDSETLLADAFLVSRLLRVCFQTWKKYMSRCDRVSEALFATERENETKLAVKVFLGLTQIIEILQKFNSYRLYLVRKREFNLKRTMLATMQMRRLQISRFKQIQIRKKSKFISRIISRWFSISHVVAAAQVIKRRRFSLLSSSFSMLLSTRVVCHLANIQRDQAMEQYQKRKVFAELRARVKAGKKRNMGVKFNEIFLKKKTIESFAICSQIRRRSVQIFFPRSSSLGPFLLYKLSINAIPVHPQRLDAQRISASVMAASVWNWRRYVDAERAKKRVAQTRINKSFVNTRQEVFLAWRSWQRREANVRIGDFFLRKNENLKLRQSCRFFWNRWRTRLRHRTQFKHQLLVHVNSKISRKVKVVLEKWFERVLAKRVLIFFREKIRNKNLKKRVFATITNLQAQREIHNAQAELSDLHLKKRGLEKILRIFVACVERKKVWKNLTKRGDFLQNQIWMNRWINAVQFNHICYSFQQGVAHALAMSRFDQWFLLWRIVAQEKMRNNGQKRLCFEILFANKNSKKSSKTSAILINFFHQKWAIRSLKRNWSDRKVVAKKSNQILAKSVFRIWIQRVFIKSVFSNLEFLRQRFVMDQVLTELGAFAKSSRSIEIEKIENIVLARIRGLLNEWRLLMLFKKVVQKSPQDKIDLGRFLRFWNQQKFVASQHRYRDALTKQKILSKWNLPRKVSKQKKRQILSNFFQKFRLIYVARLQHDLRLIAKVEEVKALRVYALMREWQMIVEVRKRVRVDCFSGWAIIVKESRNFFEIFEKKNFRILARNLNHWKERMVQRFALKSNLVDFNQNQSRRLIVSVFIGFARNSDERKKIHAFSRRPKISVFFDKWIAATVTVISIKDVCAGIIAIKRRCVQREGFRNLVQFWRISNFCKNRQKSLSSNKEDNALVAASCLAGWRHECEVKSEIRRKMHLVWKSDFFEKLKQKFSARNMKIRAAELYLYQQTNRLETIVGECLFGWRNLVEYERQIFEKKISLTVLLNQNLAHRTIHLWRTLLDIHLYKSGVHRTELALSEKLDFRCISKFLNLWILRYLDRCKMEKNLDLFYAKTLCRRVFAGFSKLSSVFNLSVSLHASVVRRTRAATWKRLRWMMQGEVRAEKEWKNLMLKRVLTGFRKSLARKKNADRVIVVVLGQREAKRIEDIKSLIWGGWQLVVQENRLGKILNDHNSYQEQRRRISPELSYRNHRNSPSLPV